MYRRATKLAHEAETHAPKCSPFTFANKALFFAEDDLRV